MKKQMTTVFTGNFYAARILILSILVAVGFSTSMAQDSLTPFNRPELKFIGNADGKLVFQLDYQSMSKGSFTLEIVDQDGYELYRERSNEKIYKKQFAIAGTDLENNIISVVITSKGRSEKFEINRSSHTIEDIRIVRQ